MSGSGKAYESYEGQVVIHLHIQAFAQLEEGATAKEVRDALLDKAKMTVSNVMATPTTVHKLAFGKVESITWKPNDG